MKRSEREIQSATNWQFILGLLCVVFLVASGILLAEKINDSVKAKPTKTSVVQKKKRPLSQTVYRRLVSWQMEICCIMTFYI